MTDWLIYRGDGTEHDGITRLPGPPEWRVFGGGPPLDPPDADGSDAHRRRAAAYQPGPEEVEMVNAVLYLRRPLLLTGPPGTGKSTLAYNVARELRLGPVLRWPITSATTLRDGLYSYDAIARLQDTALRKETGQDVPGIGRYLRLGPLGTVFLPYRRPRVLLIDELDKSDIDLPDDLLTLFEEGAFEIPELARATDEQATVGVRTHDGADPIPVTGGQITCRAFPLVIITSNGEREFPPPFLRRCLQLEVKPPRLKRLTAIVRAHLGDGAANQSHDLIEAFFNRRDEGELATDQLMNAIFLRLHGAWNGDRGQLVKNVMHDLRNG